MMFDHNLSNLEEKDHRSYACTAERILPLDHTIDDAIIDEIEWPENNNPSFNIQPDLDENIRNRLRTFLRSNLNRFAKNNHDLGTCNIGSITINTGDNKPVFRKPYPVSEKQLPILKKCINEMIEAEVIRPAQHSYYAAPVLFVPKRNGEMRFCINYTDLNKATIPDHFPLPNIQGILRGLKNSKYFTLLDLKSGFWQIPMDKESIHKTTFIVPWGIYECTKMPFGLKNNPSEFSRIMYQILGHLEFVLNYIDDITIHSKSIEDHFKHIQIVIETLAKANLKLNASKCQWFKTELNILGHNVSEIGISMDKSKIESVLNFPTPSTLREILVFLGMTGYYRSFIKNYASITQPLQAQLKIDQDKAKKREKPGCEKSQKQRLKAKLEWTVECDKAFKSLQQKLVEDQY